MKEFIKICNIWRLILFISINLLLFVPVYPQNKQLADSLIEVLERQDLRGTEKLNVLYQITLALSSPEEIVKYSDRLLDEAIRDNSQEYQQLALMSLGTAYRLSGDLDKGLQYLISSTKLAEQYSLTDNLDQTYAEIATVYAGNSDLEKAISYYKKAADLSLQEGDSISFGITIHNIGIQQFKLKNLDSALYYHSVAEKIFDKKNLEIGKAYVIGNRAIVKLAQGEVEEAEIDFQQAISMLEPLGDQYAIADFLNELGKVYVERGDVLEAIETISKGLEIAKEIDIKAQIRDASELLSGLYQNQGEFEQSLVYHKQFVAYKDSIQNTETIRQLANQQTEFEIGQAQARMDAQRKTQQVVTVALIFGLGLLTVFGISQYRNSRQRMHTNQVLRDQKAELETQKAALEEVNRTKDRFFSIISHDLRGPVNAFHGVSRMIKFFVQNKQMDQLEVLAEEIDQSVDRLSSLLDNLLNWAVQQQGQFPYVPEKIDIKTMADDLVDVFTTMAKSKQISLSSSVPEDMNAWADRNTTMTIIRNLVSNALKFTPKEGYVNISARSNEESIEIEVSDNGVGIPQEKLDQLFQLNEDASTWGTEGEKGLGLGLQLVHEFVELNQGQIKVESQDGKGTKFIVTLPTYSLNHVQEAV